MKSSILSRFTIGLATVVATVGLSGSSLLYAATEDPSVPNQTINTNLNTLNNSGASGTGTVELLDDNKVRVKVNVSGTSPNLPHAQHLHYIDSDSQVSTCPTPALDKNNDGIIDTAEGQPAYGEVIVSLTTKGDVGAGSALAVDRFPVADAQGNVSYERTFTLPEGVSREDVTESVIVHHGISELFADKTKYDGDKKSSLDPKLPLEATVPAACGALDDAAPTGGADAGVGSTSGIENSTAIAFGAAAVAAAGALLLNRKRSEANL